MEDKTEKLTNGVQTFKFSVSQMDKAIRDLHDLMERCLIPTNWVCTHETARDVKDGFQLRGDKITAVLEKKYVTEYVQSTLRSYVPEVTDEGFSYEVDGVPVEVKFINRKYAVLKNPDFRFHMGDTFWIPNPFEPYWKVRHLIQ